MPSPFRSQIITSNFPLILIALGPLFISVGKVNLFSYFILSLLKANEHITKYILNKTTADTVCSKRITSQLCYALTFLYSSQRLSAYPGNGS
jgi:hypothetical protein